MRKSVSYLNQLRENYNASVKHTEHEALDVEDQILTLVRLDVDDIRGMTIDEYKDLVKATRKQINTLRSSLTFLENAALTYKEFF